MTMNVWKDDRNFLSFVLMLEDYTFTEHPELIPFASKFEKTLSSF